MDVRAAAPADREPLARVLASDKTFRPDEIAVALELIDGSLAGDPAYELRVASEDGGLLGYICFGQTPMTRATYDLYWIDVDAAARGRGVARRLISAMESEIAARGGGQVRVETSETDGYGAARVLYEKAGYPEAVRMKDFYGPGDALIVYYKAIAAR